jgi:hypothetical protein
MSRPVHYLGIENPLGGVGYSPRRHHKIDRGNDDLALRHEKSRTIAAIPDPDIASSGRFGNGIGGIENRNPISIECLQERPPSPGDELFRHNVRVSYRFYFRGLSRNRSRESNEKLTLATRRAALPARATDDRRDPCARRFRAFHSRRSSSHSQSRFSNSP